MPDMLVRLYDLPDPAPYIARSAEAGIETRRLEPWERSAFRRFIEDEFSSRWADEAEPAFARQHVSAFFAVAADVIVGFAAYECTRRGYFGPTGVRQDLRGRGIGGALLLRCLQSMLELGYAYAVIGGAVDAVEFYENICGAFVIPGSDRGIYRS